MSDAMRLQQNILSNLQKLLPNLLSTHVLTMAMMITGLLRGRNVQLRKMAEKAAYPEGKQTSLVDRFRRFFNNPQIAAQVEYNPMVLQILNGLSEQALYLVIDSSKVGNNCLVLMVSVYYQHRALPLAWVTYQGRKGHSSQTVQLALFRTVQSYLKAGCQIVLLGDGEFDGSQAVQYFQEKAGWEYVCRTDESTLVLYQGAWCALKDLPLADQQEALFTNLLFTKSQQVGPVNILAVWHATEQRHWFFVTSATDLKTAKSWYKKRFTTAPKGHPLFSDIKKRGFRVPSGRADTRLKTPQRIDRLLLVVAITYVFTVWFGMDATQTKTYLQLIRTDDLYYSLFQLGLIYLDHLLNQAKALPAFDNFALPKILPLFGGT
jgi:hypothetical protein